MTNFKCSHKTEKKAGRDERCSEIKMFVQSSEFVHKVFPFRNGDYWDQPSSFRLLQGLIRLANEYRTTIAGSFYTRFSKENGNLDVMVNCERGQVEKN